MKVYSKDGMEMMDIKSIHRDGENLVLKGKVMGALSAIIVIRPEDCWQAVKLLGISVIVYLPVMLVKGLIRMRRQK